MESGSKIQSDVGKRRVDLELRVLTQNDIDERARKDQISKGMSEKPPRVEFFVGADWESRRNQLKALGAKVELVLIVAYMLVTLCLVVTNAFNITSLSDRVLLTLIGVYPPIFFLTRHFIKR